jgi:hypothetical protein
MNFIGRCMANDAQRKLWIDIPKNASTSIKYNLTTDWQEKNWMDDTALQSYSAMAVFRDPKDRWVKSWIELCDHKIHIPNFDLTQWLEQTDFTDPIHWDEIHLRPQSDYLVGLTTQINIVSMHQLDQSSVCKFLDVPFVAHDNRTADVKFKAMILSYFTDLATSIDDIIKDYYSADYTIYDAIE